MKIFYALIIVGVIAMTIINISEHLSDKPRCCVCGSVAGYQIKDIWACDEHWSRAQALAIAELNYHTPGGHRTDGELLQRIYEILKERTNE